MIAIFGITKDMIFNKGNIMARNISVFLGNHFDSFVEECVKPERYASASDAVRAGLRLLVKGQPSPSR